MGTFKIDQQKLIKTHSNLTSATLRLSGVTHLAFHNYIIYSHIPLLSR